MTTAPFDDIVAAFAQTPLPGLSFPLPMYDTNGALPSALKDFSINKKQGLLTAYMTVYHNDDGTPFVDPYQDIISPGAFSKTIQELDLSRNKKHNPWLCPNLWQHDRNEITGGVKALAEDSRGVIYETQFAMGVRRAQEAFELASEKMLGSSYGYDPIRFDIQKNNIRNLKEMRLKEISQVSFPANDLAPILETKQYWAWSHVPVQAAQAFQDMGDAIGQEPSPTAPATDAIPPVAAVDAGASSSVEKMMVKATDFATRWQAQQLSQVRMELYSMTDLLTMSILDVVTDDAVTDEKGSLSTTIQQFSDEVTGEWLADYLAADDEGGADYDSGFMGYAHADLSRVSLKSFYTQVQEKTGKVISQANKKRIVSSLASLRSEVESIEQWLSTLDEEGLTESPSEEDGKHTQESTLQHKAVTPPTPAPDDPQETLESITTEEVLRQVESLFTRP